MAVPTDFGSLIGWYDFSDVSTLWKDTARTSAVSADGDLIKGVTDKSGSGNHLAQATTGPVYKTAIQNGLSVSRWSAAGGLNLSSASPAGTTAPVTAFAVANCTTSASQRILVADISGPDADILYFQTTGKVSMWAGGSVIGSAADVTGAFHQFTGLLNGASSKVRMDGSQVATGSVGTNAPDGIRIGSSNADIAVFLGDIGEVFIYAADETTNFAALEAYLTSKWFASGNVTVTPAAGAITFTGQTEQLLTTVTPTAGAIAFTGQTVQLVQTQTVTTQGQITFTGQTVNFGGGTTVIPTAGAITFSGQQVSLKLLLSLNSGAITFTGQTVTASAPSSPLPGVGARSNMATGRDNRRKPPTLRPNRR